MPFAQAPGARLFFESTGSGAPIVFVHETAADRRSWEAQVRWFSRSYRCVTFNARGYPPSERSSHPADHHQLADDIRHVMDAAGVKTAFVVGFSMGAYFAANFAVKYPERVDGLVLAGLGTGSDEPEVFRTSMLAAAAALRGQGVEAFAAPTEHSPHRRQLQRKDSIGWATFLSQLREQDAHGLADILEHCHASRPSVYTFEAALLTLKTPTLIVVGDEDVPCIGPALFLKRTISTSALWICPRSGHAVNLEEPALFNAAVGDFIHFVQQGAWSEQDPSIYSPR